MYHQLFYTNKPFIREIWQLYFLGVCIHFFLNLINCCFYKKTPRQHVSMIYSFYFSTEKKNYCTYTFKMYVLYFNDKTLGLRCIICPLEFTKKLPNP